MKITKKTVLEKLEQVMDPEIHHFHRGSRLIYGVVLKKDTVKIVMTLTTIGCPLFFAHRTGRARKNPGIGLQ
jgi:metal-sulfur cluster biosynthetic enzyme